MHKQVILLHAFFIFSIFFFCPPCRTPGSSRHPSSGPPLTARPARRLTDIFHCRACASKSDAKPEFTSPLKSSQLFKDIGYIPIIVSFFPIFSLINSPTFSFGICRENASSPNRFSSAICRYRSSLLVTFLPLDSLSIFRL